MTIGYARVVDDALNYISHHFDFVFGSLRMRDLSNGKSRAEGHGRVDDAGDGMIGTSIPEVCIRLYTRAAPNVEEDVRDVRPWTLDDFADPVRGQLKKH